MKQNRRENDLYRAMHFVTVGEERIAKQQGLIADLKSKGRSTKQAKATLEQLQRSHLQMRNYLHTLQSLRNVDARLLD
jgi:hypothetical protein